MYKSYLAKQSGCAINQNFPTQLPGRVGPKGVVGVRGHTGNTGPIGPVGIIGISNRGPIGPTGSASITLSGGVTNPITLTNNIVSLTSPTGTSNINTNNSYNLVIDKNGRILSINPI